MADNTSENLDKEPDSTLATNSSNESEVSQMDTYENDNVPNDNIPSSGNPVSSVSNSEIFVTSVSSEQSCEVTQSGVSTESSSKESNIAVSSTVLDNSNSNIVDTSENSQSGEVSSPGGKQSEVGSSDAACSSPKVAEVDNVQSSESQNLDVTASSSGAAEMVSPAVEAADEVTSNSDSVSIVASESVQAERDLDKPNSNEPDNVSESVTNVSESKEAKSENGNDSEISTTVLTPKKGDKDSNYPEQSSASKSLAGVVSYSDSDSESIDAATEDALLADDAGKETIKPDSSHNLDTAVKGDESLLEETATNEDAMDAKEDTTSTADIEVHEKVASEVAQQNSSLKEVEDNEAVTVSEVCSNPKDENEELVSEAAATASCVQESMETDVTESLNKDDDLIRDSPENTDANISSTDNISINDNVPILEVKNDKNEDNDAEKSDAAVDSTASVSEASEESEKVAAADIEMSESVNRIEYETPVESVMSEQSSVVDENMEGIEESSSIVSDDARSLTEPKRSESSLSLGDMLRKEVAASEYDLLKSEEEGVKNIEPFKFASEELKRRKLEKDNSEEGSKSAVESQGLQVLTGCEDSNSVMSETLDPESPIKRRPDGTIITPKKRSRRGSIHSRVEIDPETNDAIFRAEQLFEYQWPQEKGAEYFMLQEQLAEFVKVKSFKRKYPDLYRKPVEMKERDYLMECGVVTETQCDLGLTAVRCEDVYDLINKDYPDKYQELLKVLQEKEKKRLKEKNKYELPQLDKNKLAEYRKRAIRKAAEYNKNFMTALKEERRAYFDLQTMEVHYPQNRKRKYKDLDTNPGPYPVALIPGQFQDYYKQYTPSELQYLPLNSTKFTVPKKIENIYADPKFPSDSESESSSDSDSDDSSSGSESDGGVNSATQPQVKESSSTTGSSVSHIKDEPAPSPSASTAAADADSGSKNMESEKTEDGLPLCRMCNSGPKLNEDEIDDEFISCSDCKTQGHVSCLELTREMLPIIKSYSWQCMECKTCVKCMDAYDEDKMMFCDRCDRGYHTFCVGLMRIPSGRWKCPSCKIESPKPSTPKGPKGTPGTPRRRGRPKLIKKE